MRRMSIAICLAVVGLSSVLAESEAPWTQPVPAAREIIEILEEAGDTPLSDLVVGDLLRVADLASVAHQQQMHIRKSTGLSLFVPGLGQFVNGKPGTALGFFAADLAIHGTGAVLGYLLLPPSVQFANLNYLQTPIIDIEDRWKDLTVAEFLPSAAVAISASILSAIVRHVASRNAHDLAVQAVEGGTVVFEPVPRRP